MAEQLDDRFAQAVQLILEAKRPGYRQRHRQIRPYRPQDRRDSGFSTGTPAYFVHPAEASHGDLGMLSKGDVVLAISNSGEAPELANLLAFTRRFRFR